MNDDGGIGLVLARASELRSKITNCIPNSSSLQNGYKEFVTETEDNDKLDPSIPSSKTVDGGAPDEEEEEEADSLLNIRDALLSLEAQLNSLQALQQQQCYEKEAALTEIDYSRKKLLNKLREYKGDDLEVIREATAFASETVEENNDLLLPPYPTRPSPPLTSDNRHLPHLPSTHKSHNGISNGHELKDNVYGPEPKKSMKGMRLFVGAAVKTVLTVVSFITVLSLTGFEPKVVRKRNDELKILEPFQQQTDEEKSGAIVQCPPGKVVVVEKGETRCVVKERVEIPFGSVVDTPDVSYGCG